MRISHQHRFVFFAAPKTGSRSVRKLLDGYSEIQGRPAHDLTSDFPFYNHMRPVELREVFRARGWVFDDYFKFVLVRNPWSRLVSLFEMYSFRKSGQLSRFRRRRTRHRQFREWVRTLRPEWRPGDALDQSVIQVGALSFLGFAGDEARRPLVDAVVKLEEIESQLPPLLRRLGIAEPAPIPRVGRGRYRGSFRDYYDGETRTLVSDLYRDDIERFAYTF